MICLFISDSDLVCAFDTPQYLKKDLMREFDNQVNDFMDSLIEESTRVEAAPLPAVFSPPLSDRERSRLGYVQRVHVDAHVLAQQQQQQKTCY